MKEKGGKPYPLPLVKEFHTETSSLKELASFFTIYANVIACISKKEIIISFKSLTRLFLIFYPQEMNPYLYVCAIRTERLERGPLLTVETEVNGDSKTTNERGPSLVGSLGLSCRYKRFSFCLGCSSRPRIKYFFPHCAFFLIPLSPSPSKRGRQLCWVFCLLVCVSGYEFGSYIIVPDFYCTRSVLHRENCTV